jgi:ribonucleoside-diphosphate reductase beta chain
MLALLAPAKNMSKEVRKIFNPEGDDSIEGRKLFGGNPTGIANLNSVKYKWAPTLYNIMLGNHWVPQKVSLVEDKVSIKELTPDELVALKNTLSFLIALDQMQTNNLPKIGEYITAPEVSNLIVLQTFQEMIHSQSYQYILQELFPSIDRDEIYNYWRTNPHLLRRNTYIASLYEQYNQNPDMNTYRIALAADFALEGIYFYNGFNFFYQLASRNKGVQMSKMIKYIENDEVTHVSLMRYLIEEAFDMKNPEHVQILRKIIMEAVEQEIAWGVEIYGDRILGISTQSTEQFVKYIANQRAKLIGLGVLYPGFNVNPYAHLEAKSRENFFETTVTEYSQSTAVGGWDSF